MDTPRLLVPTDFSPCADAAWATALALATRREAELHLWHALEWPSAEGEPDPESLAARLLEDARQRLSERLEQALALGLSAFQHLTLAAFEEGFQELQAGQSVDLVVMGTHGTRGLREWMYGSRTQRAVRTARCPVLAVKRPLEAPVANVLFLTDLEPGARAALESVREVVREAAPDFHILHVQLPRLFHEPVLVLRDARHRFAEGLDLPHAWYDFPELSLEHGVQRIRQRVDLDLVALGTHGRSDWTRTFRHSLAEGLLHHLDLPVLVVPMAEAHGTPATDHGLP
jgi:nucleotide-binding universal stress UspA family protein